MLKAISAHDNVKKSPVPIVLNVSLQIPSHGFTITHET